MFSAEQIKSIAKEQGTPLFLLDCDIVRQRFAELQQALPNVKLHYAIKALPQADVVRTIDGLGGHFDIATSGEIELLTANAIDARHCIHTHPIKTHKEIKAALRFGCSTFVVDNETELKKFQRYGHRVGLILRVSFRGDVTVDLSKKFGCAPEQVLWLVQQANTLGLHIKGLSFHIGSQAKNSQAQADAITHCIELMQKVADAGLPPLRILDIGGGFPAQYRDDSPVDIYEYCSSIRQALKDLPTGTEVYAEPGRYLVASAGFALCEVVGKAQRNGQAWYYLDDGVYGLFSGQIYDHAKYPLTTFTNSSHKTLATVAGPTCDSIDVIAENIELPVLEVGDLVLGSEMGAYTLASATEFNSIPKAKTLVFNAPAANQYKIAYIGIVNQ